LVLKATPRTGVPPRTCRIARLWVIVFQRRTDPFEPPAASICPFRLKATLVTAPLRNGMSLSRICLRTSQTLTLLKPPDARVWPVGANATLYSGPLARIGEPSG